MWRNDNAAYGLGISSSAYQGSVAQRAVQRAGHCKNLNGHIFEICYKDKFNTNMKNIVAGKKAYLTKSPTAIRDDIIVKQKGKIVQRFQCKDTSSVSGARDTVKRIQAGQYARTKVVGTSETSKKVNGILDKGNAKTTTRIQNSNISSKTTALIAYQANGANPLKHLDLIGHHAGSMAKGAAVLSGGFSVLKNGAEILKRRQDLDEGIVNIAADTGKAALAGGVGSAVDVAVTMAIATVPPLLPAAKPIGAAAGLSSSFCVNKVCKAVEKSVNQRFDKKVERRFMDGDDGFSRYLKKFRG